MRTVFSCVCVLLCLTGWSQRSCVTENYLAEQKAASPLLATRLAALEKDIQLRLSIQHKEMGADGSAVIRIPVVVHVVYHNPEENISEAQIKSQIAVLNQDYNRRNADTVNTPSRFKPYAANCGIEFALATVDPNGRASSGIVRKYSATSAWTMDDKVKKASEQGDNAWDSHSYLNIWVCNLRSVLGYSSVPGCDASIDGVVINYSIFGTGVGNAAYNLGRTATHEIGHWLGLKHIWGDSYCGDDGIGDTPKQGNYTLGCPSGFRSSCDNGTLGDMYMNFMDYTNDACLNMFTEGQKARMRAWFETSSGRASLLASKALGQPWNFTPAPEESAAPAPEVQIKWSATPNPVRDNVQLQFEDPSQVNGGSLTVMTAQGQIVQMQKLTSKSSLTLNLNALPTGVYLVVVEKDGLRSQTRLVRQ